TRLPWADPGDVAALGARIPEERLSALGERARLATRGRSLCFGRFPAGDGLPVDWHLHPETGRRWDRDAHWSVTLRNQSRVGDVKRTWEIARFPHAYDMARAAALGRHPAAELAEALDQQIRSFVSNNPFPRGVHWS